MQRAYLPFLVFAVLFILTITLTSDAATSVVPGWHTTIFPPFFLISLFISVALLIVVVGYWKLAKGGYKVNLAVFIIHLMLTIPAVIHNIFPLSWITWLPDQNEVIEWVTWEANFTMTVYALFVLGQVLFLIYFFKTKRLSPQKA